VQEVANPAYLEGFPFPALPPVAPYCVPGGVRVVSNVATTCLTGGLESGESSAVVLLDSTKFKGECCKDCTTLSSMQLEVPSVRHKTLRLCNLLVRDLLPCRRRDKQADAAQPIEDNRNVVPDVNPGGLACTKVHAENRTFVWCSEYPAM
jgi:hypothetical protein